MGKRIPVRAAPEPLAAARVAQLPSQVSVAMSEVAESVKDGLLAFSVATGLVVVRELLEADVSALVGPKHAKLPERSAVRHGATSGSLVLGGRTVSVTRPRARTLDGHEVGLDTWAAFSSRDLLDQIVLERMLAGVATRRHGDVAEPLGEQLEERTSGAGRSAVSRRFVAATTQAIEELMSRDLSTLQVAVAMIDGVVLAGQCCVVALLITSDGRKVPAGIYLGDTENKTVVAGLLSDLQARGLSVANGILVVIDGSKALAAGVRKVWGEAAQIQRCTLHKRRDVAGYLSGELAQRIDRRLAGAFAHPDPAAGLRRAQAIAAEIKADHPDAAASLLEGLPEMFTVRRLGLSGTLAVSLSCTNSIESMFSVARRVMGNVKRWRDGEMKKRWLAAGLLEAERSFRRIRGCEQMPVLLAALARVTPGTRSGYDEAVA